MIKEAIITLFLNAGEARKQLDGFRDNVRSVGKDIKKNLTGELAGFFGAGSIVYGFKKLYDNIRDVADLSDRFHLPVEEISQFQAMITQVGGSSQGALKAISKIEQAIVDLRTTSSGPLLTVGNQIGLSMYRPDGEFKNSFEIIQDLHDKFKNLNDDAQIKVATELGLDDPAALRLLRMSEKEFTEIKKQAQKFEIITTKSVQSMIFFQKIIGAIKQSLMSGGYSFLEGVQDALERLNISFGGGEKYITAFQKLMKFLGVSVGILTRGLFNLGEAFGQVVFFILKGLSDLFNGVWTGISLILKGVTLFASYSIQAGEKIILLLTKIPEIIKQAWNALNGFVDEIIASLGGVWDRVLEKAKRAFDKIADYFKEKWDKIKSYIPDFLLRDKKGEKEVAFTEKINTNFLGSAINGMHENSPVFQMTPTQAERKVEREHYFKEEHVQEIIKEHQSSYTRPAKPVFNITINGGESGQILRVLNKAIYNGTNSVVPA